MNEELTKEVLEAMKKCRLDCPSCSVNEVCSKNLQALATALLEERAKPKVWDGAPEWATNGRVHYWTNGFDKEMYSKLYTRELPKTRAREIAEEVTALVNKAIEGISVEEIEAVLTKYAEELKGEA
jgi:hypothetical protein